VVRASPRAPQEIAPKDLFWGAARKIMRSIFLSSNKPLKSISKNSFNWVTSAFESTILFVLLESVGLRDIKLLPCLPTNEVNLGAGGNKFMGVA
jgi:hypothetical protein